MDDVVTSDDLPDLRAFIAHHADREDYSDQFKAACREAIEAIERALLVDNDADGQLKRALDAWVEIGRRELFLRYFEWSMTIH